MDLQPVGSTTRPSGPKTFPATMMTEMQQAGISVSAAAQYVEAQQCSVSSRAASGLMHGWPMAACSPRSVHEQQFRGSGASSSDAARDARERVGSVRVQCALQGVYSRLPAKWGPGMDTCFQGYCFDRPVGVSREGRE
ncbi:predicted protein [Pyrenophora tritici-repentis Pt-1C-BFP]|uniref:Uncharacterized protein n=1 Tax=Pyrenophora tritici-repentis (strain Pt-1C-BFP) TaxID=426418 RepID=B2VRY1_PYRTR|nr:uncharacterized protein PTRG_00317 [Pyrenophora tritici-repentis Pt-1C-BFP]EDU39756.1 predicted protein [Pyrenophora tritici-repentis Pt-1C-BFP]